MPERKFERLQEATFKYPDSKTGEIKDRSLFVLDFVPEDCIKGISLTDCEDRDEILETAKKLNELINRNMNRFRNFKLNKIVSEEA